MSTLAIWVSHNNVARRPSSWPALSPPNGSLYVRIRLFAHVAGLPVDVA